MDETPYQSPYQPPPEFRDRKEPWDKFVAFVKQHLETIADPSL